MTVRPDETALPAERPRTVRPAGSAAAALGNLTALARELFGVAEAGLSGADEDVFVFNPTQLGPTTAGAYSPSLFFDGSGFGLAANDVFGIDVP